MTLEELRLLAKVLRSSVVIRVEHEEYQKALRLIEREINLKTNDPRKHDKNNYF
jgi:hypothetical protein